MEALTIVFSTVFGLLSSVGLILEGISETAIGDQFATIEELRVRIDNAPTYQILQGRVDRVRIAGRGLTLKSIPLKIAVLEVETDPIDFDRQNLGQGWSDALQQPLQAGIRIVLTEEDLNPEWRLAPDADSSPWTMGQYTILNPRIDFLEDHRLRIQVEIQEGDELQTTQIVVESGLTVQEGRYITFVDPVVQINQETVPTPVLDALWGGKTRVLDLDRVLPSGTLVRLLEWELTSDRLEVAAFVRIEATNPP